MRQIKDVEIRTATAEDIKLFYPAGAPRTSYAWVALYKGQIACLAGLIIERGGAIAYSEMNDVARAAPRKIIWLTAQALLECIKGLGLPMHAACEKLNARNQAFVERLGFVRQRNYQGMELFVWQ